VLPRATVSEDVTGAGGFVLKLTHLIVYRMLQFLTTEPFYRIAHDLFWITEQVIQEGDSDQNRAAIFIN
jgi:hypothetical protein